MSLVSILTYVVAILTVLAGVSMFIGASKNDRGKMGWFCAMAISAAVWGFAIAIFMGLKPETSRETLTWVIAGIYLGGAVMATATLGFFAWDKPLGKFLVITSIVVDSVLVAITLQNTSLFFSGHEFSDSGNVMYLVNGWPYWLYAGFLIVDDSVALLYLILSTKRARLKKVRHSNYIMLVAFGISGMLSCVFDLVLPMFNYTLIWVGPVLCGFAVIAVFYSLLRYRIASVDSRWMKVTSAIVLTCTGVMVYMVLFYLIFTSLFKIPNPSASILVLNFLMIVIVLMLLPVINEIGASVRSMISVGQVDIAYVIRKLNRLASRNVDLRDLAGFLADHLHFSYIGFVINGRLYGSKSLTVTPEELSQISHMKQTPRGIWQEPNKTVQKTFDNLGIKASAELRNAKGKTFGQLIVGNPLGKSSFEHRDLIQLEMIINLVATVIDSEKHLRA